MILFYRIRYMHLYFFAMFVAFSATKRYGLTTVSTILGALMPSVYLVAILYAIYFVKRCQNVLYDTSPGSKILYAEIWVLIETQIFFLRLFTGMAFLLFNYFAKVQAFARRRCTERDANPWGNKNTEDFLRHLKVEFYLMTSQLVNTVLPILFCYFDTFKWIEIGRFGPRTSVSVTLTWLSLTPRIALLTLTFYAALT